MMTRERLSMPLGEAIFTQRAIRRLKPGSIPDEALRDVLEAAIRAPNGGNRQGWHFLVVTDQSLREQLGVLYREAWWAKRADAGIQGPAEIPERDRTGQSAMRLANEIGSSPVLVLMCATARGEAAAASIIPAAQNLLLAARALGIGGTITTLHPSVEQRVRELLGIPEAAQVVYCLPLGYPRGRFGANARRPLAEVSSLNRWGEPIPWA